jgi:hypothetical protein
MHRRPSRIPFWISVALIVCVGVSGCESSPDTGSEPRAPSVQRDSPVVPPPTIPEGVPSDRVRGQTLYVPCYSHIYFQDDERTLDLASTLTVRNTSLSDTIAVARVDYYDSDGALVRRYLESERTLPPLASTYFVVREDDLRGGVGANFIVTWTAEDPVDPPFVEAVHITTKATLGVSFTSDARVLTTVE